MTKFTEQGALISTLWADDGYGNLISMDFATYEQQYYCHLASFAYTPGYHLGPEAY